MRRLLADPKARGMAEHFFGQWLGFAGFDRNMRGPDIEAFPEFTPEVRRSLHREAVVFFEDLIRNDRDVRLIVGADYSFVDETLQKYYGVNVGRELLPVVKKGGAGVPDLQTTFKQTELKATVSAETRYWC